MIKKINGTTIKSPSSCTWGLQDISSEDSGRTTDGTMHIDRITQKLKFDCVWNGLTAQQASTLLNLVCPNVFISLTYYDPLTLQDRTKVFYTGDKSAPVHVWNNQNKTFSSITFSFIEQ